jgi:hypothetical protein
MLYEKWRPAYAHLPAKARGRIVRGCIGKAMYETKAEAEAVAKGLPPREPLKISVYPCDVCKSWHVGNTMSTPGMPNRLELR